jgi:hypothetical protein
LGVAGKKGIAPIVCIRILKSEIGLRPIGAYAPEGRREKAKPMEPGNKLTKKSVF